jgi:hypothetical protein
MVGVLVGPRVAVGSAVAVGSGVAVAVGLGVLVAAAAVLVGKGRFPAVWHAASRSTPDRARSINVGSGDFVVTGWLRAKCCSLVGLQFTDDPIHPR